MSIAAAKDIFLEAIDLPVDRQEKFVAGACAGDETLRARVEGLLRSHRSRPGLLERPAVALDTHWPGASTIPSDSHPPRRAEQPGDVIDRYRLVRPIGEGGFGSVFLAQQTVPLVRDVALKVIRRGMDTDQVIARFAVERQALAMMDHPGIARVIDAGATASGRPYFVMEYVEGIRITEYSERNNLSVAERLELIEQTCLAVQHAHQKGIIHRDLKPGNILVTQIDGKAIPKIIDFGIAKAMEPSFAGTSSGMAAAPVTHEAQVVGTPQYMSPEQATGGASRVDTRTDVYSLGAILYELVAGAPAVDVEALRKAGVGGLGQILRDETPAKPSKRLAELRQTTTGAAMSSTRSSLRGRIADEIDWIVMKALEKDPARRYQSAAEMAADIRRQLTDQAVLAGPPSRTYALRKFSRRHRVSISAAAVVAITLLTTAIISAVLATHARRAEHRAREQAQRAQEELARANAVVGFTDDLLAGIGPSVARGRDTTLLREIVDTSIRKTSESLAGQPAVELAVRNLIANALYDLGDAKTALAQLRAIYDATADPPLRDHPERLRAAALMAQMLVERNEVAEADKLVNEALDGYHRIGQDEANDAYNARLAQAAVDLFSGRSAIAEQRFAAVLAHYRAIGRGESTPAIHAWNNLALAISEQGRWEEAVALWREVNAVDRRIYGDDHPYTLMTLTDIGTGLVNLQKFDEGESVLREALELSRKIYPPGHPTLLVNMNNFATLLFRLEKYDDMDEILTEALETGQKKLGVLDQPMDTIILQLGKLRAKQGRFDEAVKYAQQLHGAVAAKLGERHVKTLSALVLVYDNLLAAGRAAEGVAIVVSLGELPADVPPDLRQRLCTCAGLLYLANGDERSAAEQASLARASVTKDRDGKEHVTPSLQLLESKLHPARDSAQPPNSGS